jgi:hypothetical protein
MKKIIYILISMLAATAILWSCDRYDDSELRNNIDAIEAELSSYEKTADSLQDQISAITQLKNSSFISFINKNKDGTYVITYMNAGGQTNTITLATQSDVNTLPLITAGTYTDGKLYWRSTSDNGVTYTWLKDATGNMMPVGGTEPIVGIDTEGYWTVNGVRYLNASGKPVLANDVSNTLFKDVSVDSETSLVTFTLSDGTSFQVQIYEALNITFSSAPVVAIPNRATPATITYTLTGTEANKATVDYFTAYNVTVSIDTLTHTIKAALADGAEEGNTVIIVSAKGSTVLKPIFFTYGSAVISDPLWDSKYGTGTTAEIPGEMTQFYVNVSANIGYSMFISADATSWLHESTTKAEMVTTPYKFVADYYENTLGAARTGTITFYSREYGVTVTMKVRQSPVINTTPTDPGISTGADLVAFATAVNAGASTARWQNAAGEVILLNDIDLTGLNEWTPIGFGGPSTGTPAYGTITSAFKGVFNGQGHTIKGINWTYSSESKESSLFGLFGAISGGTVKNLVFGADGDSIKVTGTAASIVSVGAIAGYIENGTIANVKNNVDVILKGDDPDAVLMMLGGIVGTALTSTVGGATADDAVINSGNVKTGRITNTANGGTGMHVAGICAFSLGLGTSIGYCTNYGEVSAPTGRGGGIVGTMGGSTTATTATTISNCTNAGLIQDDEIGQYGGSKDYYNLKRMGGLVGGTVSSTVNRIEYCTNKGNVFSQLGCRAGGFAGHNNGQIVGCVNKGIILSNITIDSNGIATAGPGWACGYSSKGMVTQCAKGGKVGEWDKYKDNPGSAPDATDDNALAYKNADYYDPTQNN